MNLASFHAISVYEKSFKTYSPIEQLTEFKMLFYLQKETIATCDIIYLQFLQFGFVRPVCMHVSSARSVVLKF